MKRKKQEKKEMSYKNNVSKNKVRIEMKIFAIFLVIYVVLYMLGELKISPSYFTSPLYIIAPIPSFFLTYYIVDWLCQYFETRAFTTVYFGLFLLILFFKN